MQMQMQMLIVVGMDFSGESSSEMHFDDLFFLGGAFASAFASAFAFAFARRRNGLFRRILERNAFR